MPPIVVEVSQIEVSSEPVSLKFLAQISVSRAVFLNRWVTTHFWVVGIYVWVTKTCVIVLYDRNIWVAKVCINLFCGSPTTKFEGKTYHRLADSHDYHKLDSTTKNKVGQLDASSMETGILTKLERFK